MLEELNDIQKNVSILPLVADNIRKNKIKFEFTIVGDGSDILLLKKQIKDLDVEDNFRILGNLPRDECVHP